MIAHVGPVPLEELLPLALVSGGGLAAIAWLRLRSLLGRIRRSRPAARPISRGGRAAR